jgi:hypothetical protein
LQVTGPADVGAGQYQTLLPQVMPKKPTASVYQASPVTDVELGIDELMVAHPPTL